MQYRQITNKFSYVVAQRRKFFSFIFKSLGVLLISGGLLSVYCEKFLNTKKIPEFSFDKNIYHPDSIITLFATSKDAQKKQNINFYIDDEVYCDNVAPLIREKDIFSWRIDLKKLRNERKLHSKNLADGEHKFRFGFSQKNMSASISITFDS